MTRISDSQPSIKIDKSKSRIPSLDGLRAISILMVVLQHSMQRMQLDHPVNKFWGTVCNGSLGVYIFFVISGYLITTLLLNEHHKTGNISLPRFYFRRSLRIFPPLYLYLAFITILSLVGLLRMSSFDFLATALFFRNYVGPGHLWALEHTWSLGVEEQFYLLWPMVLLLCLRHAKEVNGRIRAAKVALWVIALCPLIRLISGYFGTEYLRHATGMMFHSRADSLMFGCIVALLIGNPTFERLYQGLARFWWLFPILLFLSAAIEVSYRNVWDFPVGFSLDGVCIAVLMLWCVRNPDTWVGRFLNSRPVRHIGVLSYSIYIWQTFFLHAYNRPVFGSDTLFNTLPTNWIAILLAAECSYWLVELKALRLRDRIEKKWAARRSADVRSSSAKEIVATE